MFTYMEMMKLTGKPQGSNMSLIELGPWMLVQRWKRQGRRGRIWVTSSRRGIKDAKGDKWKAQFSNAQHVQPLSDFWMPYGESSQQLEACG